MAEIERKQHLFSQIVPRFGGEFPCKTSAQLLRSPYSTFSVLESLSFAPSFEFPSFRICRFMLVVLAMFLALCCSIIRSTPQLATAKFKLASLAPYIRRFSYVYPLYGEVPNFFEGYELHPFSKEEFAEKYQIDSRRMKPKHIRVVQMKPKHIRMVPMKR